MTGRRHTPRLEPEVRISQVATMTSGNAVLLPCLEESSLAVEAHALFCGVDGFPIWASLWLGRRSANNKTQCWARGEATQCATQKKSQHPMAVPARCVCVCAAARAAHTSPRGAAPNPDPSAPTELPPFRGKRRGARGLVAAEALEAVGTTGVRNAGPLAPWGTTSAMSTTVTLRTHGAAQIR